MPNSFPNNPTHNSSLASTHKAIISKTRRMSYIRASDTKKETTNEKLKELKKDRNELIGRKIIDLHIERHDISTSEHDTGLGLTEERKVGPVQFKVRGPKMTLHHRVAPHADIEVAWVATNFKGLNRTMSGRTPRNGTRYRCGPNASFLG